MARYRSFISLVLIAQMLLMATGCYVYQSMTNDGRNEPNPNNDGRNEPNPNNEDTIRLTLKDGSVIISPPLMHVVTREPSDLIIGTGQMRATSRTFKGLIESGEIDSARTIMTTDGEAVVCWLKNKTAVAFKPREYLRLTIQNPPGLWCIGEKTTSGGTSDFRGIVLKEELADIEVEQLDVLKSAAVAAAPVLLVVVLYEIVSAVGRSVDEGLGNLPSGPR